MLRYLTMTVLSCDKGASRCVCFLHVVSDLVVKVAKDKFGAIQSEYQKVSLFVYTLYVYLCLFIDFYDLTFSLVSRSYL